MTPANTCARCDGPMPPPEPAGRRSVFCGAPCRIAHRAEIRHLEARSASLARLIESAERGRLRWTDEHLTEQRDRLDAMTTSMHDLKAASGQPTPRRNDR